LSALEKWRNSSDKRASIENLYRNRRLEHAENPVWRCGPDARREMATIISEFAAKDRPAGPALCRQKATRA
jgi:hypothetical protein